MGSANSRHRRSEKLATQRGKVRPESPHGKRQRRPSGADAVVKTAPLASGEGDGDSRTSAAGAGAGAANAVRTGRARSQSAGSSVNGLLGLYGGTDSRRESTDGEDAGTDGRSGPVGFPRTATGEPLLQAGTRALMGPAANGDHPPNLASVSKLAPRIELPLGHIHAFATLKNESKLRRVIDTVVNRQGSFSLVAATFLHKEEQSRGLAERTPEPAYVSPVDPYRV
ncbi:hypothetical protein DFJ74DRAFT_687841 [Hyaloraphidium curvatum]|nr:hypothetical protein DFJ74DRAFT_687841 [Hyaloraphidium curvatum]